MGDSSTPGGEELERAQELAAPLGRFMQRWRRIIAERPWLKGVYKVLVTLLGVLIVVVGLVLVPLPGPGWLIVFIGLTVLGSEYHWVRRLTSWLRWQLSRFWAWWKLRKDVRAARKAERRKRSE